MSAPRLLLLATTVALALLGCRSAPAGRDAGTPPPRALPDTTLATFAVDDSKALFDGLRAQFRDASLGVPVPTSAAELLEHWAPLPEAVRRHVPEAATLRGALLEAGAATRSAIAVRVTLEADRTKPFGVEVPLFEGGPAGSRFVAGRPTDGAVLALSGDVLVVADDLATLEQTLPHLAQVAMPIRAPDGLTVELRRRALEGPMRRRLDEGLESAAEQAIAGARAERARHVEAPAFGEPEQIVFALRDRLRRLVAYLPDLDGVTLRIAAGAGGVRFVADGSVVANSPLARALDALRPGPPFGLARLPAGTAVAFATRRAPDEAPWAEVLAPIAGGALVGQARTDFEAALARGDAMRGDASVVAIGAHDDGPFLLVGFEPGRTPLTDVAVRDVVALPYVTAALGRVVGCDPITLRSLARGRSPLCAGQLAVPELTFATGPSASDVVVAIRPAGAPAAHAATQGFVGAQGPKLFDNPDAARALSALSERTLVTFVLSGRALIPSLGLFDSSSLRTFAASRRPPTDASPLVVSVERPDAHALRVVALAPPRALEELYAIAYLVMAMSGG